MRNVAEKTLADFDIVSDLIAALQGYGHCPEKQKESLPLAGVNESK